MWDVIVLIPDNCLSIYFITLGPYLYVYSFGQSIDKMGAFLTLLHSKGHNSKEFQPF